MLNTPRFFLFFSFLQTILFSRFPEILQPYKYAGYPMLIRTIEMETADDRLFAKPIPLLPAACELAYYTVKVSALNAEELRRENGLEIVAKAFSRCIDVISPKTNPQETSVQVCTHLVHLYGSAALFEKCREVIAQNVSIIKNLCRCLTFQGAPLLTIGSLGAVSAFAVDSALQELVRPPSVFLSFFFSLPNPGLLFSFLPAHSQRRPLALASSPLRVRLHPSREWSGCDRGVQRAGG